LATTDLVKGAFFCKEMPIEKVPEFEKHIAPYESFIWPLDMMKRDFVNVKTVLGNIRDCSSGERVLVLAGGEDKLMGVKLMQQMANTYRAGHLRLATEKAIDVKRKYGGKDSKLTEAEQGVRFGIVEGAGHHLQNDLQWKDGAMKLLDFHERL